MSHPLSDLETVLQGLVDEYRKLLAQVQEHEMAVRTFNLKGMDALATQQQATRLRIASWENRRKTIMAQLVKTARLPAGITLGQLADFFPPHRESLLKLREELKVLAKQIAVRTRISGRVTSAVLGHLNTAVRLLAGAVEKAGLYTKQGIPQVSRRIGVMEAVG